MMSASLVNGTLLIQGTAGDDRLTIAIGAGKLLPTDREKTYWISLNDGVPAEAFRYKEVKRIEIRLGNGNDTANQWVSVDTTGYFTQQIHVPVVIDGGAGNDDLWVDAVHATLNGSEGDDTIWGDSFGSHSSLRIDGGPGNDSITGSDGNDRILARDGDDYIDGRGGNDVIYGGDGADTLIGGDGRDYLRAGAGNDGLIGGNLTDIVFGGAGADTFDFLSDGRNEIKDYDSRIDKQRLL
jgi:Ca2+-binding RTX toxin-like protein